MKLLRAFSLALLLPASAVAGGGGAPPAPPVLGAPAAPPQSADAAARALARLAYERHGGAALSGLRTLEERSVARYYGPDEAVVLQAELLTRYDLVRQYFLSALVVDGETVEVQAAGPQGFFAYTPGSGAVPLPPTERALIRQSLRAGPLALRGLDRAEVVSLGEQTWAGASGAALRVTVDGVVSRLLVAPDGTLLAERITLPELGEVVLVYGAYRALPGEGGSVLYPRTGRGFLEIAPGEYALFFESESEAELNPTFEEATFALPD